MTARHLIRVPYAAQCLFCELRSRAFALCRFANFVRWAVHDARFEMGEAAP